MCKFIRMQPHMDTDEIDKTQANQLSTELLSRSGINLIGPQATKL